MKLCFFCLINFLGNVLKKELMDFKFFILC